MVRKLMTAALVLTLGLSLAACGTQNAGTAAKGMGANAASQDWAIQRQREARGPLEDSGSYKADTDGRVKGYDTDSADGKRSTVTGKLKQAGDDLADGAGSALKDTGEATKDVAEGAGNAVKEAAKGAGSAAKKAGDAVKDAARSVGDAAEDTLDGVTGAAKDTAKNAKK